MGRAPKNSAPVQRPALVVDAAAPDAPVLETAEDAAKILLEQTDGLPAPVVEEDHERLVRILSDRFRQDVQMRSLIVVCREPGFRRAGFEHPQMAVYPREDITDEQIALMRAEPMLVLIEVG